MGLSVRRPRGPADAGVMNCYHEPLMHPKLFSFIIKGTENASSPANRHTIASTDIDRWSGFFWATHTTTPPPSHTYTGSDELSTLCIFNIFNKNIHAFSSILSVFFWLPI